jgi:hypothetical protein
MKQNLHVTEKPKAAESRPRGVAADGLGAPRKSGCRAVFVYIEEIHKRAVTLSPLLKELLEFRPGWN